MRWASARVDRDRASAELTGCSYDPSVDCDIVSVEITSGDDAGFVTTLEYGLDGSSAAATLRPGDKIVLSDAGIDVPEEVRFPSPTSSAPHLCSYSPSSSPPPSSPSAGYVASSLSSAWR